jgi:predicted heme/steroid binding protein
VKKIFLCLGVIITVQFFSPLTSLSTTDYARQTGRQCKDCHVDAIGGGPLTEEGQRFRDELKIAGLYRPLTEIQKVVRLIVGYVHLMTAIMWFGTILYVHILLKPAYASKGLPRGELVLGWISMILISITGVLLTIARIPSWKTFYITRFGILLSIKIALFLIMFLSAVIVTLFIGPRLRKQRKAAKKTDGTYSTDELSHFDGREGRPAYIAYQGALYDVTGSKLWKGGSHLKKHNAGNDLTDLLKTAPHGEEKVLAMPAVGTLRITSEKTQRPFHERLFYFFAYMNLAITFLIVFVIALWRWW